MSLQAVPSRFRKLQIVADRLHYRRMGRLFRSIGQESRYRNVISTFPANGLGIKHIVGFLAWKMALSVREETECYRGLALVTGPVFVSQSGRGVLVPAGAPELSRPGRDANSAKLRGRYLSMIPFPSTTVKIQSTAGTEISSLVPLGQRISIFSILPAVPNPK